MKMKQMLTVDDVADIFEVSTTTVNKWINSNDLSALKVGMVRRIYAEDVKVFFEKFYTGEKLPQGFPITETNKGENKKGSGVRKKKEC